jgi:hypothetical protein
MGKLDKDNKADPDVLRAADIMPPFDRPIMSQQSAQLVNTAGQRRLSMTRTGGSMPDVNQESVRSPAAGENNPTNAVRVGHTQADIPKFDLAEGLLADRRMISAAKRKSPSHKVVEVDKSSRVGQAKDASRWLVVESSEQRLLIAEIVSRDIARLCRGDVRSVFGQDFRAGQ